MPQSRIASHVLVRVVSRFRLPRQRESPLRSAGVNCAPSGVIACRRSPRRLRHEALQHQAQVQNAYAADSDARRAKTAHDWPRSPTSRGGVLLERNCCSGQPLLPPPPHARHLYRDNRRFTKPQEKSARESGAQPVIQSPPAAQSSGAGQTYGRVEPLGDGDDFWEIVPEAGAAAAAEPGQAAGAGLSPEHGGCRRSRLPGGQGQGANQSRDVNF